MNKWEEKHNNFWLFTVPPCFIWTVTFTHTFRHTLGATPTEDKRSRKAEVEVPGLAADHPKSGLHPSAIHSLDINIFPSIEYESGWYSGMYDSGKRQWKSYFMSFVLLSIFTATRAGSSMDVTSARLLWIHPGLPEEAHQGLKGDFLFGSTTECSIHCWPVMSQE